MVDCGLGFRVQGFRSDLPKSPVNHECLGSWKFLLYLEGQEVLVSRLLVGIIRVTFWGIGAINLLTQSP